MSIEFSCAGCGKLLRVPDSSSGGHAACPSCGSRADVPYLEAIYLDEPDIILEAEILDPELPSGRYASRFPANQYANNPFRQDGMLHPGSIPAEFTGSRPSDGNGIWILLLAVGVFASIAMVVGMSLVMMMSPRSKPVGFPRVAERSPAEFQPSVSDLRHVPVQMPTMPEFPKPKTPSMPQMRDFPEWAAPKFPAVPDQSTSNPGMPTLPGLPQPLDEFQSPPAFPSTPGYPAFGSNPQATVSFEIQSYSGTSVAQARGAVVGALAALPWVDLSRLSIDLEAGEIVVGARGRSVSTVAAKAALQAQGFQIGATRFSAPGQSADPSVHTNPWERTGLGFGGHQRRGEVVLEMKSYPSQRGLPAQFQVRSALLRLRWVDPTRIQVDLERFRIVVGTRPSATEVDPQTAKAFLEKAGFEIESAEYYPEGQAEATPD